MRMSLRSTLRAAGVGLAALVAMACGGASPPPPVDVGSGQLSGAGATFPEPFYTKAFYAYNQKYSQVSVNYQSVGSGAGVQQFTKGTVDFGASDVPMNGTEVASAGGADSLVQIPTTLGVISMAYNLQGVSRLQLDGDTIVKIFQGQIKKWNEPALTALNTNASLPNKDITVVHRSDGSGTSYAFTDYLAKQNAGWKDVGKSIAWPAGVGAKGNDGVAGQVKQTDGAIGYVELAYVVQSGMRQAWVRNKNGKFLQASVAGATAAAAEAKNVSPTNFSITDEPGDASYPITSFSWIFLKKSQTEATKGKALVYLFKWLTTDGQAYGKDLQYAPLPKPVEDLATATLKSVTANGTALLQ